MDTLLILAGGESVRFGRPKALVDVGGRPMVARVFEALGPLAGQVVVSVADSRMAEAIRQTMPRAKFVLDRRHGMGPIEGMFRGFEIAAGQRVLVAPCDAPLLRNGVYRLLLDALGERDAAVPKFDVVDPVRAVYRREAVRHVLSREGDALRSPSSLVDRLDAAFVNEAQLRAVDPRLDSFLDVNREEDLRTVRARLTSA